MLMVDDDDLRDRAVMLRRWGRRSELHFFGSKRRDRNFWEDLDGIEYDNQFIFDELAWNFEPSEIGAAFGLEQLKKLGENLARRRRNFDRYTEFFSATTDAFVLPRQLDDLETAWLGYPLVITEDAGFGRPDLQRFLDGRGIDTRTIWTGNVARQPMLRGRTGASPARRPAQRRRGHGARRAPATEPRDRRRHPRLRARPSSRSSWTRLAEARQSELPG